jgi:hypothetical protein
MDPLHADLQKVISELAYGHRMSSEEMHAYYWENDCGPLEVGGNKPDPLGLRDKYETASRFIFRQAALGVVSIFGRRGLDRGPVGFPEFPKIFSDYALIPKETFIADCHFGPGLHSVLWAKHSLIFDGWFDPMMSENDAKKLAREWPSGRATKRTGGRPPVVDWTLLQQEAHRLMEHHGDFEPLDPDWNVQAKLEELLLEYCSNTFGKEPSVSALRTRIPSWLDKWRLEKVSSGQKLGF